MCRKYTGFACWLSSSYLMHPYLYCSINICQSILSGKFRNNNVGVMQRYENKFRIIITKGSWKSSGSLNPSPPINWRSCESVQSLPKLKKKILQRYSVLNEHLMIPKITIKNSYQKRILKDGLKEVCHIRPIMSYTLSTI